MLRRVALAVLFVVLTSVAMLVAHDQAVLAQATRLDLAPYGGTVISGVAFTVTVTAYDASDAVDESYNGTVSFTSSDSSAQLPEPYDFKNGDKGSRDFTVILFSQGSQLVTVTDTGNDALTNTETWSVSVGDPHHIVISPDSTAITAGSTQTYAAEAFDIGNNSLGDVTSQTTFSIDVPAGGSWSGAYNNVYTSQKAGTWTVTGTYSGLSDTATLNVIASSPDHIVVSPELSTITAGNTQTYTAQFYDQFDNPIADATSSTSFSIDGLAGGSWGGTYNNVYTSQKAGTWTVTGTYGALSDNATLNVTASSPDHIVISPDNTTIMAGNTQTYNAEAFDIWNNILGDVTSQTTFSIDLAAGGSWTANVYTSQTSGNWTVTGTYSALPTSPATTPLNVTAGIADHIVISPDNATIFAGLTQAYNAQAFDIAGNPLPDVTSSTVFTTSPAAGGSWTANVYASQKAGTWTVTGTYGTLYDTTTLNVTASSAAYIVISPDNATIIAGSTQAYNAQAFDIAGNPLPDVTSSAVFTTSPAAGGSWTANVYTSQKAGTWTVTGTYGALSDNATLSVNAGPVATSIAMTPAGGSATAGSPFTVTVTARDAYGNVATGYTGTVRFTSSDLNAILPANYAFIASDNGTHTFTTAVTLRTSGSQTITITDTVSAALTNTENWAVTAGPATHIVISPNPDSIMTGASLPYAAASFDQWNNRVLDVTSSTVFTIDPAAGGFWTGNRYTSDKLGTWTVTGTYPGLAPATAKLTVTTGTVASIEILPDPSTITAGSTLDFYTKIFDAAKNSLGFVDGTVFTIAGDHGGSWSGNQYTSAKAGTWTVTGTYQGFSDTAVLTVTADTTIDHYHVVSTSYTQQSGTPFTVTFTAYDRFDNLVNNSSVSVTLSSSSTRVSFDTDGDGLFTDNASTLTNGTFTISARSTVAVSGITITASDGAASGTSDPYTIVPDPANNAPVARSDSYDTDQNAVLEVRAPGVLANDLDVDGDTLTAILVRSVNHGTLTLNPDGSFTYTPNSDFTGTDSFTYRINDGKADSTSVDVSITVGQRSSVAIASGMSTWFWAAILGVAALLASVLFILSGRKVKRPPVPDSVGALRAKMDRLQNRVQSDKKGPDHKSKGQRG